MAEVKTLSQSEYAKHRGVSEAAVSKAIKARRITLTQDGRIDPVAADAQWAANSRVRAGAGRPPASGGLGSAAVEDAQDSKPGNADYWDARSRREMAEAETAEMELAKLKGELIEVKAVESVWAKTCSAVREHLLQVRSRLAPQLAAESDPFKVDQMLEAEHNQALAELATAAFMKGTAA